MFKPHRIRVVHSHRISPNFQRVTFRGVDDLGPAGPVRDLRVKLIIPGAAGLPELDAEGNWFEQWRSLDAEHRGHARTYSIRNLRRGDSSAPAEVDIDFVIHADAPGPASAWAAAAQPGDELYLIGPRADDDSGAGIEFVPQQATSIVMLGDETALPAIAKTLQEWPSGASGRVFVEIPELADKQELELPDEVTLQWLPRSEFERERGRREAVVEPGELLVEALEAYLLHAAGAEPAEHTARAARTPEAGAAEVSDAEISESGHLVWETPTFSSGGAELTATSPKTAGAFADSYFWIAGEAGSVVQMRRLLVGRWEIPRSQVSFMGYWKQGLAARG